MYSQDWRDNLETVAIDENSALYINVGLEIERVNRMRVLLSDHGHFLENSKFQYNKYTPSHKSIRCYDAAVEMARKENLVYVEGVVFIDSPEGGTYPLCHGWCCTKDGVIVDPTMNRHQHKTNLKYLGVPIKLSYVDAQYQITGYYGLLDGRHDGAKAGIHYDPPASWLDTINPLGDFLESILGPEKAP